MENDDRGRPTDREGFVLWIDREAGALRGVLERTSTSERVAFDSGERLLAILRGAASTRSHEPSRHTRVEES